MERKRIITPDDDFLDIDLHVQDSNRAILLLHGLEGNSTSLYNLTIGHHFMNHSWDIIAVNFRSCSGEMNNNLKMYHSGATYDLHEVITQCTSEYEQVVIIGTSLGGNQTLKYLGEKKYSIPDNVIGGVAISTPIHLSNASQQLLKAENLIYQLRFIKSLAYKIVLKNKQFPGQISRRPLLKCWNLYRFDEYYTAPIYGYSDAEDYYKQNSSAQFLNSIERPALLINSLDDPFLGDKCYPKELAKNSNVFSYCETSYGGHAGFTSSWNNRTWLPKKIEQYLDQITDT